MDLLEHGLGVAQTELQDMSETVEALQQAEPQNSIPNPPEPEFPRPERAAGDRRRATLADSTADETASACTGSDVPVHEIVTAIQTSTKEADKIELPNIPEGNHFRTWRIVVREAVASSSRGPKAAFLWIRKSEVHINQLRGLGRDLWFRDPRFEAGKRPAQSRHWLTWA